VPGILLTLLIGPTVAIPAPPPVADALLRAEVTHSDEGRSGFQLSFDAGRSGPEALTDSMLLSLPLLKPFNRVILVVSFGALPAVLMDGVITHQQLQPGSDSSGPVFTVSGEDVSLMMDLEEKSAEHPAQPESIIALKLIGSYAQYGLVPMVIPPLSLDPPIPTERVPVQQGTDLRYLQEMAERFGYVFYVMPGPAPSMNTAYWGPPLRVDLPQHALSVDLGPTTNVTSLSFTNNALTPTVVTGSVQDRSTGSSVPVEIRTALTTPLASESAIASQASVRTTQFRASGLTSVQALARAQGIVDRSADAVTGEGVLDAVAYGSLLKARALVGVRGAGATNDGTYYVKRVTHTISSEGYTQRFSLTREGTGALLPVVVP
jgi:hypothetical protein